MLNTIAFISFFSAALIFFSDDLIKYAKALTERPYAFLACCLLLASYLIQIYSATVKWLLINYWIYLLEWVYYFSIYFHKNLASKLLAKWLVAMILPSLPIAIAWYIEDYKRKHSLYTGNKILKRGYGTGLVFWLITVSLFVSNISDFNAAG